MENEEIARRLLEYARGQSDSDIAQHLRITDGGVASWREQHNLPPKGERDVPPDVSEQRHHDDGTLTAAEQSRRILAWWASADDSEAAHRVGLSRRGFESWRQRHEVPPREDVDLPRTEINLKNQEEPDDQTEEVPPPPGSPDLNEEPSLLARLKRFLRNLW